MTRSAAPWQARAAYFYLLHLPAPAIAWEYLRRNPAYRRDWQHRRTAPERAGLWGLSFRRS